MKLEIRNGKIGKMVGTLAGCRWVELNTPEAETFGLQEELLRSIARSERVKAHAFSLELQAAC